MRCLRPVRLPLLATLLVAASLSGSALAQGLPVTGTYNGTFTITPTGAATVHDEGTGTSIDAPYGLVDISTTFDATALDPFFENQTVSNGALTLSGTGSDTLLGVFTGTFNLPYPTNAGTFILNGNFNGGTGAFAQATGLFTATGAATFTGATSGILSATITGQVTPEPSSLAFLTCSALTAAAFLRRRKTANKVA